MRTLAELKALIKSAVPGSVIQITEKEKELLRGVYIPSKCELKITADAEECNHRGLVIPYIQTPGVRKYNISNLTAEGPEVIDFYSGPASDACMMVTTSAICVGCGKIFCLPNPEMEDTSCGN